MQEKPYVVNIKELESKLTIEEQEKMRKELISLHFKEIGLEDVINMLSDGGRNFRYVIHPDVGKKRVLGLVLEDVTWQEALEVVLKLHDLYAKEEHGLLVINTYDNYIGEQKREAQKYKFEQERAELQKTILSASMESRRIEAEERKTFMSFRLKYTQPKEVLKYMLDMYLGATETKGAAGEAGGTTAGKASGDAPRFSIFEQASVITAYGTPKQLDEVAKHIADIDVAQNQIFIESRIVEILRNYTKSLGIQWGGQYNNMKGPLTMGLMGGADNSNISSTNGAEIFGARTPVVNYPASDPGSSGAIPSAISIGLSDVAGTVMLNTRLSMLERDGKSKTLANPKVTTINGVTAKIESGREIPYVASAGGGAGATTVEFKNAVISLEVTPFVTPDGKVNMKIQAQKDDADFTNQVQNTPSIITRSVETTVLIQDGGTAVLGGVFENFTTNTDTGVPILSRIPILGHLFKGSDEIDNEKELLIFITPNVIKGHFG